MKHVSTQTNRMVDVAMATVTAAETEEAIGVGSGSGDDSEPQHDPELQVRHFYRNPSCYNSEDLLHVSCRSK